MNKLKNLLFIVFLLMAGMVQAQDVGYLSYIFFDQNQNRLVTTFLKTTDGGANWVSLSNNGQNDIYGTPNNTKVTFPRASIMTANPKLEVLPNQSLKIFPNPTSGITKITTENYNNKNYVVMSLTGQVLLQNNLSDVQTTIDLAALQTKGAYIILIRDTQTQQVLDKNIVIYK